MSAKYKIYDFLAGLRISISQGYGENVDYYKQLTLNPQTGQSSLTKGHEGVDFPTLTGTPLFAPFDGIIVRDEINQVGWKNYGIYTVIWDPIQCIAVWFCHLEDFVTTVGQKVKAGDLLLHTNNSGNSSGPHVHVNFCETDVNGVRLNQDNGSLGFLNIMDPTLVEVLPLPGKDLSVPPFGQQIAVTPGIPSVTPADNADLSQGLTVYKGLDMTNVASMKAAIDAWYDVSHDVYVRKTEYDALQAEKNQAITDAQTAKDNYTRDLKNYTEMKAAGYTSLSDINTKIEVMESDQKDMAANLLATKDRNKDLSDQIKDFENQDIAFIKQWLKSKDNVSNLENIVTTFAKILKAKPDLISMLTAFDSKLREYDTRLKRLKENQVTNQIVEDVVKQEIQTVEKDPSMWSSLFRTFLVSKSTNN